MLPIKRIIKAGSTEIKYDIADSTYGEVESCSIIHIPLDHTRLGDSCVGRLEVTMLFTTAAYPCEKTISIYNAENDLLLQSHTVHSEPAGFTIVCPEENYVGELIPSRLDSYEHRTLSYIHQKQWTRLSVNFNEVISARLHITHNKKRINGFTRLSYTYSATETERNMNLLRLATLGEVTSYCL